MNKKCVAVISKSKEFSRFLELELILMNFKVEVLLTSDDLEDRFDGVILDEDSARELMGVYNCPIISFSQKISEPTKIKDTYKLPKPCSLETLHNIIFEMYGSTPKALKQNVEEDENVIYITDSKNRYAVIGNYHFKLTECELLVLEELCMAQGDVVSRERLSQILGNESGNLVDVYVCYLRKKLECPLNRKLIFSARGQGYSTVLKMEKREK